MPNTPMSIDQLVDWLAEEDKYWERTIADPKLWEDRKLETAKRQEWYQKKRYTLKHMNSRDNPASESLSFSSEDMFLEDDYEDDAGEYGRHKEDDIIDMRTSDGRAPAIAASSNSNAASKRASTVAPKDRCPTPLGHRAMLLLIARNLRAKFPTIYQV